MRFTAGDQTLTATVEDHDRLHGLRNYHFEEAITRLGKVTVNQTGPLEIHLRAGHINPDVAHGLCVSGLILRRDQAES